MNVHPPSSSGAIERVITTGRIVTGALAAATVMYAVVGTIVAQQVRPSPESANMLVPLVAVAAACAFGSILFRRLFLTRDRLEQVWATGGEAGLSAHLLRTTIVSAALAEAVAVIGLVLGILSGDTYYLYVLVIVGLVAVLFAFPRAKSWRAVYTYLVTRAHAG